MKSLGYIENLEIHFEPLGLEVVESEMVLKPDNTLNRARIYLLRKLRSSPPKVREGLMCPIFSIPLSRDNEKGWMTSGSGIGYPIFDDIPILRPRSLVYQGS
jgi:hypothetical protein